MSKIDFESPAVQSYLTILQGVINRMAANSSGCKTWCIALVSAIVVIIADKNQPDYVWIALLPVALFCFLDAYYLGLERSFRERYNQFIEKLHSGTAAIDDVFIVTPGEGTGAIFKQALKALISVSVWTFYGLLTFMLVIVRLWVVS